MPVPLIRLLAVLFLAAVAMKAVLHKPLTALAQWVTADPARMLFGVVVVAALAALLIPREFTREGRKQTQEALLRAFPREG